jgi:two-component system, sensor histidine kinase and response regulator
MTANAMHGDREKCLAAGMDDYLPKPIRSEALRKALEQWGTVSKRRDVGDADELTPNLAPVQTGTIPSEPPVDMQRFRELGGGDPRGVADLIRLYLQQTAEQLENLSAAIFAGVAPEVRRIAHSCVGASGTCGMLSITAPLQELERMGERNDLTDAARQFALASTEFEKIRRFLTLHQPQ